MSRTKNLSSLALVGLGVAASAAALLPVQANAAAAAACNAPAGQHCVAINNPKGSGIQSVFVEEESSTGHFADTKNYFCAVVPQGVRNYYPYSKFTEGKWIQFSAYSNSSCAGNQVGHFWSFQIGTGGTRYIYVNATDGK
jgi:hypothetical protein